MGRSSRSGLVRSWRVGRAALVAGVVLSGLLAGTPAGGAAGSPALRGPQPRATTPLYYVALGDSLAAGVGATTAADSYVDLVAQHELARFPGLQLENFSCAGATTGTMLDGGGTCAYSSGTQLGDAEAFLEAHQGQVAFVTIDIGANDVDHCVTAGTFIDLSCLQQGIAAIESQLPQILAGLARADPGLPVFGMNYYDPFLAAWLLGSAGQALAVESVVLADQLNDDLAQIYGAAGYPTADVADAFATDDVAMTGSYNGQTLPHDVANICNWTFMCTNADIHTNDTGHSVIAAAFDQQVDGWFAGGTLGLVLASRSGGVYSLGNAAFFGSLDSVDLAGPITGAAASPSHTGYWLCGGDGGVFAFGDAGFDGSMAGRALNAPVVGIASTPTGRGYWLVAADGGVFSFGDAGFDGSMAGRPLDAPVVGIASTPTGRGYWLVAADGGVFSFGDAGFDGSMAGRALNAPVVGIAPSPTGRGYLLGAGDGGVFAFGDARYPGSMTSQTLRSPVIAVTAS
ncbi:MAG TPA: SGNH/GDSL hydrolase family protein [Acidimicrobiales bacterium]|nr:SGNH/GDSL hydrolase family protein [Acidimicrobiales bacterium]